MSAAADRDAGRGSLRRGGEGQPSFEERLQAFVGQPSGDKMVAPDPVNQAMIRHWVEAMGDFNPVYVDEAAARAAGFPGIIAPPTMLQAWIMRGLRASLEADAARAAGTVPRELAVGAADGTCSTRAGSPRWWRPTAASTTSDRWCSATASSSPRSSNRSPPRSRPRSGSGTSSPPVSSTPIRTASWSRPCGSGSSKFKPKRAAAEHSAERRPRTARSGPARRSPRTTSFFFEGAKRHELLIQRCTSCGVLRHPPRPACANCRSFEWDTVDRVGAWDRLQLRRQPLPAGAGLRLPAGGGVDRARGGHAARRERGRHRPRRDGDRYAGAGDFVDVRRRADPAGLHQGTDGGEGRTRQRRSQGAKASDEGTVR